MERFISLIGLITMLAIAYAFSNNRKKINWRTVVAGISTQFIIGIFILKTNVGHKLFDGAKALFNTILSFSNEGASFLFGSLSDPAKVGFVFITMVLPTIIFMSTLMSVFYHLGIMQKVVGFFAKIMLKIMGTSGAESLSAAANVFVGQNEAPLVVKPYIKGMTKSELMAMMAGGMATVSGSILAAYVGLGVDAGHLLAASVMAAPGALVLAKMFIPETEKSETAGTIKLEIKRTTVNLIDAAASGASEGMKLSINVAAMLFGFVALVALVNGMFGWVGGLFGHPEITFDLIMGYVFAPVAFIIGVPWDESFLVGGLLGKKMVINEFVAYLDLQRITPMLSERATILSTYALCGFANFSSIAIQIGGIGSLAPSRSKDLARIGMRAMICGFMASLMSASIAGIFI